MLTITESEYEDYVESHIGLCRSCGESRESCEPDAEHYRCESCGAHEVFGAELLLLMGEINFVPEES